MSIPQKTKLQVNWDLYNKILSNPAIPNMTMDKVCALVYEATYMHYSFKFYEEMGMREQVEQRMIAKNTLIDKLEAEIVEFKADVLELEGIIGLKAKIETPEGGDDGGL